MLKREDVQSSVEGAYAEKKRAEEELKESEKKFQTLFNFLPDPVVIVDGKGNFLAVNDRVEEETGFKREELLGRKFLRTKIVTAKSKAVMIMNLAKIMRGMQVAPYEVEVLTKDGKKLSFEVNATKIEHAEKSADIIIFRNTMERKRMEETLQRTEEKFRTNFENTSDVIALVDKHGKILDVNKRVDEFFGYKRDEIIGKNFVKLGLISLEDMPRILELFISTIRNDDAQEVVELELKPKNGNNVSVKVGTRFIKNKGKVEGVVNIFRDVTERKRMGDELRRYSEHLEELVEERGRELKEAQDQLLVSERLVAIGELAAMVGHDLRNPLTGISGASYYLRRKLDSKTDTKTREMLDLIEKGIRYSNNIINDLLEYSGEILLELSETTLKQIIKEALSLIEVPRNIRVSELIENEQKITVDVQKIQRTFLNIIKNAIDAMPKGGKLAIKSRKTNGYLEILFTDTGTGMPKNVLEKLWKPLFTTKAKGMGLGLVICKRFVQAHGGNISVKSTVGKGTTFTVAIPIKPKPKGGE